MKIPGGVIGAIAAGIVIATAAGVVVGNLWVSFHKAKADAYRANNADLEERVKLLEDHVRRCEEELKIQRATNVSILADGVAGTLTSTLLPVLRDIREETKGVAEAQDSMAIAVGQALVELTKSTQRRTDDMGRRQ